MFELEQAAFAAWPALETVDLFGWTLRFADGYTKRANSANAIETITTLSPAQIETIEAFYISRQIQPIFRLASFCTNQAVDDALASRGYQLADLSLVMVRSLNHISAIVTDDLFTDIRTWLTAFHALSKARSSDTEQATHLKMIQSIQGKCAFALIKINQQPICCGLGVVIGNYLGLFDIVTHPDFRGQNYASRLCEALMAWGKGQGAQEAFLQVIATNTAAIHLYDKLGFQERYQYWYRMHP